MFVLLNFVVCLIREIFLTVDSYMMDECLERSLRIVYYQASGEPAIAGCNAVTVSSCTFTSGGVDVRAHLFVSTAKLF